MTNETQFPYSESEGIMRVTSETIDGVIVEHDCPHCKSKCPLWIKAEIGKHQHQVVVCATCREACVIHYRVGLVITIYDAEKLNPTRFTVPEKNGEEPKEEDEWVRPQILELGLSVRATNALIRGGVATTDDALELLKNGDDAILSIRNFGERSLKELRQKLQEKGHL